MLTMLIDRLDRRLRRGGLRGLLLQIRRHLERWIVGCFWAGREIVGLGGSLIALLFGEFDRVVHGYFRPLRVNGGIFLDEPDGG